MNSKLKRTPGIYIIGFMGSGKTTIGRMLAEEIGWRFVDLDDDIEHSQRPRSATSSPMPGRKNSVASNFRPSNIASEEFAAELRRY